jgi:hypothetical protein
MALTNLQRRVCGLLAEHRRATHESYVAGGLALNELLGGTRRSRDIDLFHDSVDAVQASWEADRRVLEGQGFEVRTVRALPSFVEAVVQSGDEGVLLEWAQDSAFRFFPLVEHPTLGLALHPFDLATNKVLALVGRREPRDLVDALHCDATLQPLGYLAWAAAGKDPGFNPLSIIEEAARSVRYTQTELDALDFEGPTPNAAGLSRRWHGAVGEARCLLDRLPPEHAGTCVVTDQGDLARANADDVGAMLAGGRLFFHAGTLRGAWPQLRA